MDLPAQFNGHKWTGLDDVPGPLVSIPFHPRTQNRLALADPGAKKGIFITTSGFTKEAREYQPKNETKIVLIDGDELTQLMIDHDLGVTPQRTYTIKRIDSDFFGEE